MIHVSALSWHLPDSVQQQNIDAVVIESDDDIRALILPGGRKDCWENCSVILSRLPDEILVRFLPELLVWFQDLNWPGVDIVAKRILLMPPAMRGKHIRAAVQRAAKEGDDEWKENLEYVFGGQDQ